jgi:hypothetical protein
MMEGNVVPETLFQTKLRRGWLSEIILPQQEDISILMMDREHVSESLVLNFYAAGGARKF